MKYVRLFLIILASSLVLGFAFLFVAGRSISSAFEGVSRHGESNELADVFKAELGATLARADAQSQVPRGTGAAGLIEYYKKNPQQLQRDKATYETWHSAATIATSSVEDGHHLKTWTKSTDISWVSESNKNDFWGHAFCVRSSGIEAVVVSPGPNAVSSLDCASINLPQKEIDQMSRGRLNFHPSGVVVLPYNRAHLAPTGN